ncbi:MAG: NepR family anti-sigma factor [Rhodobacteraceae bacterium]|nr:NepR family anti-sigma factor [Paracoccaceae bacterium]
MSREIPRDLREQIDQNLRRVYQDALEEEVPERFRLLLEELRKKTGKP